MNKSTKIIIVLEAVAMLFLVAATVISIIKGQWLNVGCNILWMGIAATLIVIVVRNDKTIQENADLRKVNDCLRSAKRYFEERSKKQESGDKTVRWFKERFVELALQMEQHHGETKEIRISPCFHTKKVEIDF